LQNAVNEKPAKLQELTLLKVWLVLEYFIGTGILVLGGGIFQFLNGNFRWPWNQP